VDSTVTWFAATSKRAATTTFGRRRRRREGLRRRRRAWLWLRIIEQRLEVLHGSIERSLKLPSFNQPDAVFQFFEA